MRKIKIRKIYTSIYQVKSRIPQKTNQRRYTRIYRHNTILQGCDYKEEERRETVKIECIFQKQTAKLKKNKSESKVCFQKLCFKHSYPLKCTANNLMLSKALTVHLSPAALKNMLETASCQKKDLILLSRRRNR